MFNLTLRGGGGLALLCALLAGCGAPTAVAPSTAPAATAQPTSVAATAAPPTTVPTSAPSVAPTTAPTATPVEEPAGSLLPAPLYFINQQRQLARIEIDGKTVTPITSESEDIFEFAVSPADGSLAYITIAGDGVTTRLVRSDALGKERVELLKGVMRGVAISFFGDSIEVGVLDPPPGQEAGAGMLAPGVWSFPMDGGQPTQIQANTPPTQLVDGNTKPGDRYMPIAWSPDGLKLLLRTSINFGPDGPGGDIGTTGLALFEKETGQVRQLLKTSTQPLCIDTAWDGLSVMVYCSAPFYLGDETPALGRVNIVTDEYVTLIPTRTDDGKINLVANTAELYDGLYSMVATTAETAPEQPMFTIQRTALDAASERTVLSKTPIAVGDSPALWDQGGNGVALLVQTSGADRDLIWYSFRGGAPVTLLSGELGDLIEWGKPRVAGI